MAVAWAVVISVAMPPGTSVSDILCAGVFPVWFRMLIRSFPAALSDVVLPGLPAVFG
jgi:hypothetical protein